MCIYTSEKKIRVILLFLKTILKIVTNVKWWMKIYNKFFMSSTNFIHEYIHDFLHE
jgi:hypothetical protein